MEQFYITKVAVHQLWGHRNLSVSFNDDMNIIIGPNASGKTTLINLLQHILTMNLDSLFQVEFKALVISLRSFTSREQLTISAEQSGENEVISIGKDLITLPSKERRLLQQQAIFWTEHSPENNYFQKISSFKKRLKAMVPIVWLPVSRRLPIAEESQNEFAFSNKSKMESVDECLSDLISELQKYRTSLDAKLADLRQDFQKHALETVLYDKQHDKFTDFRSFKAPSEQEKEQLLQAFRDVELFDSKISKRINEHFLAASTAIEKLSKGPKEWDPSTIFIIPLINRTRSMVQFAQELEQQKTSLFSPLHAYEDLVNSFLKDKAVDVADNGKLTIRTFKQNNTLLEWRHLSSGEKQILILLTQALLWEKAPVVYIADEPELSLHVTWQEKLLESLNKLAGRCQFIVATHSPDIAGGFPDKVLDLGRL